MKDVQSSRRGLHCVIQYIYIQLCKDITLDINVLQTQYYILQVGNIININFTTENRIEFELIYSCFLHVFQLPTVYVQLNLKIERMKTTIISYCTQCLYIYIPSKTILNLQHSIHHHCIILSMCYLIIYYQQYIGTFDAVKVECNSRVTQSPFIPNIMKIHNLI